MLDMVSAREDAELQQKFSSELADIPNTIPAFKCASPFSSSDAASMPVLGFGQDVSAANEQLANCLA